MQQKKHQYERDPIQLSFIVHKFKKWSFTCSTVSSKDIKKEFCYSPFIQCVILSISAQIPCVFEST